MSDVRAQLAGAMVPTLDPHVLHPKILAEYLVDALLSLPGIAIVELPGPAEYDSAYDCVGRWRVGELGAVVAYADGYIIDNTGSELGSAEVCRQFAAALLAAANAADAVTP